MHIMLTLVQYMYVLTSMKQHQQTDFSQQYESLKLVVADYHFIYVQWF